jgi:hypothetical protein
MEAEMSKATEAQQPARTLIRKLADIMGEVERVPKSGRNEFHRYDYATEADIAAAVRSGMAKRAVMLIPSVRNTEWTELPTKSGKMRLCTLTVDFTLHDGDSGETLTYTVLGEGSDSGDKATYKALTGAEKYALLKIFLIPTGDDPENDARHPPPPVAGTKTAELRARLAAKTARAPKEEHHPETGELPPEPPPPGDDDAPPDAAPPAPQPAQRRAPAPGPLVPYGRSKGKPLSAVTNPDLDWLLLSATENVAKRDPKWHGKNVEWLEAVRAEVERRQNL